MNEFEMMYQHGVLATTIAIALELCCPLYVAMCGCSNVGMCVFVSKRALNVKYVEINFYTYTDAY